MTSPATRVAVVVTAAGSSARFGSGKKELASLGVRSVLEASISPFLSLPGLAALVITSPAGQESELRAALSSECLAALASLGSGRFAIVSGGPSRRDSVRLGLEELERMLCGEKAKEGLDETIVLVHDGARPWASSDLAARTAAVAAERGAAVPVVPLVDTPKQLDPDGTVLGHPSRSSLGGAQTPQGFRLGSLLSAHRKAAAERIDCTDDAELWDRYIGPVAWVSGEVSNRKVTYARDLEGARDLEKSRKPVGPGGVQGVFRIGQGWDLHKLIPGRRLVLGGIEVPSDKGEEAHSDGDVLLHAVIDALFGAAALGDIGTHFPPSDARWKDADSRELARRAAALLGAAGWEIGNLDCTVVLEAPKLGPYKEAMRESIASCLGVSPSSVSVKAKTKEGVDATGEGRAVEASAVVLLSSAAFYRGRP
jgi:2-C-methyl-D-erythritol 4-phosphate cytidylyltransferase/2-C-methyl-D-erythritol 2,4-cyclodiphosphate synthase